MSPDILAIVNVVSGLVVLVGGGELLVRGATKLAAVARISPLVIGLTVVAFGTSAPELAVSVQAILANSTDLAVGNVVGSNIFNVLFILGVSAVIVPLTVSVDLIRRDVPIMIGVSVLLWIFAGDGTIDRWEGVIFFVGIVAYTTFCVRQSRKLPDDSPPNSDAPLAASTSRPRAVLLTSSLLIVAGLLLLALGSRWLISGAVFVATQLGVSELVIGLTIVAAGTSLPEVVTSLVAALRGERDIAVGNVVGSNVFNILCVLGVSGMISPDGIGVSSPALQFDIPVMVGVAAACFPIFFTGHTISRQEGILFLLYFVAYITFLVLHTTDSHFERDFGHGMIFFVIPLTTIGLGISFWRQIKSPTQQD